MEAQKIKIELIVKDHGDPSVGIFDTNYNVTLEIEPIDGADEEQIEIIKFGIEQDLKKVLANHLDSGSKMTIFTKEEIDQMNAMAELFPYGEE